MPAAATSGYVAKYQSESNNSDKKENSLSNCILLEINVDRFNFFIQSLSSQWLSNLDNH
jgi:hypothetical protein